MKYRAEHAVSKFWLDGWDVDGGEGTISDEAVRVVWLVQMFLKYHEPFYKGPNDGNIRESRAL